MNLMLAHQPTSSFICFWANTLNTYIVTNPYFLIFCIRNLHSNHQHWGSRSNSTPTEGNQNDACIPSSSQCLLVVLLYKKCIFNITPNEKSSGPRTGRFQVSLSGYGQKVLSAVSCISERDRLPTNRELAKFCQIFPFFGTIFRLWTLLSLPPQNPHRKWFLKPIDVGKFWKSIVFWKVAIFSIFNDWTTQENKI